MKTYPIQIEDDVHKKLKKKCFELNMTIKEVIENAIDDFLDEKKYGDEMNE